MCNVISKNPWNFTCHTTYFHNHHHIIKGVKVDLGIPKEMWHKPSAEISHLKSQCETFLEDWEDELENWYFKHQEKDLKLYLCRDKALSGKSKKCLKDSTQPKGDKRDEL